MLSVRLGLWWKMGCLLIEYSCRIIKWLRLFPGRILGPNLFFRIKAWRNSSCKGLWLISICGLIGWVVRLLVIWILRVAIGWRVKLLLGWRSHKLLVNWRFIIVKRPMSKCTSVSKFALTKFCKVLARNCFIV